MFSFDHFIWIGISVILTVILLFLSRKFRLSFKTATYILLGIYVASEIIKIILQFEIVDGKLTFVFNAGYLPFQICSITLFFVVYLAFSKNQKGIEIVKSFVLEVMLIGAPMALALSTCFHPEHVAYHFASFKYIEIYRFYIYHIAMIAYGLYLLTTKQVKMGFKAWWQSYIIFLILLLNSFWINAIFSNQDPNFMFTAKPPTSGIPLVNLKHGYFVFLVHYFLMIAIGTFLLQLPAIIKQARSKKVSK